jgi:uncharacterized integral membrane protein (TIGR00697 family)
MKKAIYVAVFLVGIYIGAQVIADVAATKMVAMMGIILPAGSIMFALTFTLRDLIHKRLGKDWAIAAIWTAAVVNVASAAYLVWMANMDAPPFYQHTESWSAIFALVPSITVASIIAELTSELVDTAVYHWWYKNLVPKGAWQWTAVVASNFVSLPLDSFIFATLAFVVLPNVFGGEPLPFNIAMGLVVGQIAWKVAVTIISMPTIYLVRFRETTVAVVDADA